MMHMHGRIAEVHQEICSLRDSAAQRAGRALTKTPAFALAIHGGILGFLRERLAL